MALTVGELRRLMSALPDDTPVIYLDAGMECHFGGGAAIADVDVFIDARKSEHLTAAVLLVAEWETDRLGDYDAVSGEVGT